MSQFIKKLKVIIPIILIAVFVIANFALAQVSISSDLGGTFGLGTQNLYDTVIRIVNVFLGFLGIIAISMILYGGFVWMTSGGSVEGITKAKKILLSAVIGLGIILLSFTITQFIVNSLGGGGGGGPSPGAPCDCVTEIGCLPGGCLSCNEIPPASGTCFWQTDNTCDLSCIGLPTPFEVSVIIPAQDDCGAPDTFYPKNSVIRIYFTKDILDTPANITNNIIIRSTGDNQTTCTAGIPTNMLYDYTVTGSMVEITPQAGTCPANPCGADKCFDTNSSIEVDVETVAIGSLLASDGITVLENNLTFDESIQFFTGSAIDCQPPTVDLLSDSQICLGTNNNLGASSMDDSGIVQVEFTDNNFNLGFTTAPNPWIEVCPAPPCGQIPTPWNIPAGTVTWFPGPADFMAGTNYTVTARVTDMDSNTAQDLRSFTLREAHCCNGIQDPNEDGIDCGGPDCAACDGASCGDSDNLSCGGDCSANNNLCASNICNCVPDDPTATGTVCSDAGYQAGVDPCCVCQSTPIIDCVTPNDFGDCSANHTPMGTEGTLITVWGRNFGTYVPGLSTVTVNGINADLAETINANCINSWTNTEIVVVVPAGAGGGEMVVTAANGYSDSTADIQGIQINNFNDDGLDRPSLCRVENIELGSCFGSNCGYFEQRVRGSGIGIEAGDEIQFGDAASFFDGILTAPMPDLLIETGVPNIAPSEVGFRVRSSDALYSNYLNFFVVPEPGGPHIDYLDPSFGPEGQYVTIYGSNLGSGQAGNDVTFGGVSGDFSFPSECADNYWANNRIIVKVPAVATGLNDVVVNVGGTLSNAAVFNVCSLGPGCPLKPGMCKMQPVMGPHNTLVDIWGEYFGTSTGDVEFFDTINSSSIFAWSDLFIEDAQVPATPAPGAETGPVYVIDSVSNRSSNSIPFEVGTCTTNNDCPTPATDVCCGGTCYTGSCPAPNFSTYTWSFATGNYFIKEECDGTNPASPSPWTGRSGGQEVCINAAVAASFTEPVAQASVNPNVLVEECSDELCSVVIGGVTGNFVFTPSVPGPGVDGFRFEPTALLNQNTWYRVTLTGGVGGITTQLGDPLIDDYVWMFKTRDSIEQCEIGSVNVLPSPAKLIDINSTQDFTVSIKSKDDPCVELNTASYNYTWSSSDLTVATVTNSPTATETATPNMSGQTYIKATVLPDDMSGQAILNVDYEGLVITRHWYECEAVCPNTELGVRFDREVDTTSLNNIGLYLCNDGATCSDYLTAPVAIMNPDANYIWDVVTGNSQTTINPLAMLANGAYYRVVIRGESNGVRGVLGSPLASLNSNLAYGEECDPGVDADCNATCTWDQTVSSCGTGREECVDDGNPDGLDGCNTNCYNTGSVNTTCGDNIIDGRENCDYIGVCGDGSDVVTTDGSFGNRHVFCQVDTDCGTNNCVIPPDSGCSSNCTLTGSIHTAVCGDGKIGWGEACDDNNQSDGDGCSSKCLREGRIAQVVTGYNCGNGGAPERDGTTEAGEDCDDGNLLSGDGCSDNCIAEGAPGSVCGDGLVGIGEDCDSEPGCNAICLWQGSAAGVGGEAVCNNNVREGRKNEAFSWVFKTRLATDDPCDADTWEIIPGVTDIFINEIKPLKVTARTQADECDAQGQTIDSWVYDWNWWSNDPGTANILTTCGNGKIDVGEDCDHGGQCDDGSPCVTGGPLCDDSSVCEPAIINNCTLDCQNDGGSPTCGDGTIDDGEDCDDGANISGDGCSANCLHEGTSVSCGDGAIDSLEDCDDGNLNDNDGCSSICLNEGAVVNTPVQNIIGISTGPPDTTNINADALTIPGSPEAFSTVTVVEPLGAVPCIIEGSACCNQGVSNCSFQAYECITEGTFCPLPDPDPAHAMDNNCYCCCDTTMPNQCPAPLECTPNISPCTGPNRGQCCGCETNADCGGLGLCGNDTCCHDAPNIITRDPSNGSIDICRNTLISAEFDMEMDTNTLRRNIEVARKYTGSICPNGMIESTFLFPGPGEVYCRVPGSIHSGEGTIGTILEFSSDEVLDPSEFYYIAVHGTAATDATCGNRRIDVGEDCDDGNSTNGDGCSSTCLREGNTTACASATDPDCCGNNVIDKGEECDDGDSTDTGNGCSATCTRTGQGFVCGDNNIEFDPITGAGEECELFDHCVACMNTGTVMDGVQNTYGIPMQTDDFWSFTTGNDICRLNDIRLTVTVGNGEYGRQDYVDVNSDLFICSGLDDGDGASANQSYCYRDALRPSYGNPAIPDNPNFSGNQHVFQARPIDQGGQQLNFSLFEWYWDEHDPYDTFNLHDTSDIATVDLTSTNIAATSNNTSGQGYINISATTTNPLLGEMSKRFDIRVFLCNNPWPDITWWPWEDDIVENNSADCDQAMDGCNDTFFELFYCRDFGDPGPEDDLPRISSNPMIFGEDIDGDIYKEFFFIEDESGSGGPLILNAAATPCKGTGGTPFYIEARIVDMDGVAGAVAQIQNTDENVIATINLLDNGAADDGIAGNKIYGGTWNSGASCPPATECSYYIDIVATDTEGNVNELENITCN